MNSSVCLICYPNHPTKKSGRGQDRYCYELLSNLKGLGIDVACITHGVVRSFKSYLAMEPLILRKTLSTSIPLFHAVSEYGAKYLLLFKNKHSKKVTTIHDLLAFFFFKHSPFLYLNQKTCLLLSKKSEKLIVTSQFYVQNVHQILRVSKEKIKLIHLGVDHSFFKPNKAVRKKRWIFYVGGINRHKGTFTLLSAFSRISSKFKDVQLVLGGKGRDWLLVKKKAKALGLYDRVIMPGFIEEEKLPRFYNSAEIFVWPSRFGFGLPILEAMACGTPVITCNTLDAPEYVGAGGLLFKPGDDKSLAKVLEELLRSDNVRKQLGRKAFQRSQEFSWENMARKTISVYEEIID